MSALDYFGGVGCQVDSDIGLLLHTTLVGAFFTEGLKDVAETAILVGFFMVPIEGVNFFYAEF